MSAQHPFLTDERLSIQAEARRFAMEEVLPVANELDPRHEDIPPALLERLAEQGYFGITISSEFGGMGKGVFEYALIAEELARAWDARAADLLLKDQYEALILASIIQKEAMLESEMPRISGVFHNRLRLKMRLQTDPTVIFGLGPNFKAPLKRSHLKKDTPYNTYTRNGLPPGPISLPGRAALLAAVNPLETEDLYFMAKGDGSHEFSRTLKEHNRAVKKYRR